MNASTPSPVTTRTLVALAFVAAAIAPPAAAQERPGPAGELAAGALLFADDGVVTEGFIGGAARFHLLPRISVGPEVAYIRGENHNHLMLTGNVTFDFLRPERGRPRRFTPFVVAGAGQFHTRARFPGRLPNDEVFASSEGAFTAGGGVRALVGRRLVAGAEVRIGWELHIRLNGILGVHFGG